MKEFFEMGGYGFYVWSSWGVTGLSCFVLLISSYLKKKKIYQSVVRDVTRKRILQEADPS